VADLDRMIREGEIGRQQAARWRGHQAGEGEVLIKEYVPPEAVTRFPPSTLGALRTCPSGSPQGSQSPKPRRHSGA
jgi:hypothetical protein